MNVGSWFLKYLPLGVVRSKAPSGATKPASVRKQLVGVRHVLDDLAGDDQIEGAEVARIEIEDVAAEALDTGRGRELGDGPIELVASEVVGHHLGAVRRQRRRQRGVARRDLEHPARAALDGVFECQQRAQSSVGFVRRRSRGAEVPAAVVAVARTGAQWPERRKALSADSGEAVERRELTRSHASACQNLSPRCSQRPRNVIQNDNRISATSRPKPRRLM